MKMFVLVLCTVFMVQARPEAGYNYNAPDSGDGSFGGSYSDRFIGGLNNEFSSGHEQLKSLNSGSGSNVGFGASESSSYFGGESDAVGNDRGYINGGQPAPQAAIIQKHFYVHTPPPEQEEFHQQRPISTGVPQKHYKIIFIKAPSSPQPTPPQIPLLAQNQEKTIVYVLVKKPEEIEDIVIPTVTPTQPSKPEVYFIKYKTQSEQNQYQQPQQQYGPPNAVPTFPISGISGGAGIGSFEGGASGPPPGTTNVNGNMVLSMTG